MRWFPVNHKKLVLLLSRFQITHPMFFIVLSLVYFYEIRINHFGINAGQISQILRTTKL